MIPLMHRSMQPPLDRRKFLIGGLFLSAAAVAAARQPSVAIDRLGSSKLEELVPKTVGRWEFMSKSGLVVPPEDELSQTLYSQLLTRVYSDGAAPPIMLLVAQSAGQTGILQIHRPEVCYPASGYRLSPIAAHPIALPSGSLLANSLTATADGRAEHIIYWTRVGGHMPTSWAEQRLAVATDNLRGLIPDAVLVRVSTVTSDRAGAMAALEGFTRELLASLPVARRRVLIA